MLFEAAGFVVAADRALPGFPLSLTSSAPHIHVRAAAPSEWPLEEDTIHVGPADPAGKPTVVITRSTAGYAFRYADATRFWVSALGQDIWFTWETTLEDACTYLAGPVIALAIRARGELALHASAVLIDGRALVLAGPPGAGKSTTAAAFGRRGRHVVADDVLRLTREDRGWIAQPFRSMLRLWPDAEQRVLGYDDGESRLPRITPTWDKRALYPDAHGVRWADAAAPVGGIVMLAGTAGGPEPASVVPLSPADALVRLAANASASYVIDAELRAREFAQLSSLVREVSCGQIDAAAPARQLDHTLAAIVDWLSRAA